MGSAMTIEMVRDFHRKLANEHKLIPPLSDAHAAMADAIEAHLADKAGVRVDTEELNRLRVMHAKGITEDMLCALLPGCYYMDPPDGGHTSIYEQLKRMAEDAARWNAFCKWVDSALVSDEDSHVHSIITDAMNMGSGCLEIKADELIAMAAWRGEAG